MNEKYNQLITGRRLQKRDLDIICDIYWSRVLSRRQIERLHFNGKRSDIVCRRRLKFLHDNEAIIRHDIFSGMRMTDYFYSIGEVGLLLLKNYFNMVNVFQPFKDNQLIPHTHELNNLRIDLLEYGMEVYEWNVEVHNRRKFMCDNKEITIEPDVFTKVKDNQRIKNYFIEYDKGTYSVDLFVNEKIPKYEKYYLSDKINEYCQKPILLVVTTTQYRVDKMYEETLKIQKTKLPICYITKDQFPLGEFKITNNENKSLFTYKERGVMAL